MAVFVYKARSKEGKLVQGDFEAETSGEVRAVLAGKGYYVVLLKEKKANPLAKIFSPFNRANYRNLAIMARQLSVMLRSGIAITSSLKTLGEQTENASLADVLIDVNKDVGEGMSLSSAFAKHDDIFPQIFINLVRSGERSGHLDEELEKLSAYLERYYDLNRKVKDAFIILLLWELEAPVLLYSLLHTLFLFLAKFIKIWVWHCLYLQYCLSRQIIF